jgi:hypothetical protein
MAAILRASSNPAARVASIIKMQSLLFEAPSTTEYDELLDFPTDRRSSKIERIVSILRAQEILLGSGAFLRDERSLRAAVEIPALIAYVRSFLEIERAPMGNIEVLPRNLGRTFAAKGWGLPLFGDYRPPVLPERGLILVYSSPDVDGKNGALEAARLGPLERLSYREGALVLDSSGYWLSLRARSSADSSGPALVEDRNRGPDRFAFSRYDFALDRKPMKKRFRGRIADPYKYIYPYCFYDTSAATSNLARFVGDVLCGIFRVPLREAEELADTFTGRLP